MNKYMRIHIWFTILAFLFFSCNSVINTVYDDTTARYNAYFLANESIEEIENELIESTIENYDSLINLTYVIDTNKISRIYYFQLILDHKITYRVT